MKIITCWDWEIDEKESMYSKDGLAYITVREAEKIINEELEFKNYTIQLMQTELNKIKRPERYETSTMKIDEPKGQELQTPNLDIDSHKDWYYCLICFNNHGKDKSRDITLRWYRCVIFSKDRKHAESIAHRKACIKKYSFECIEIIDLYKNEYKPNARQLVADNQYIY